MEDEWQLNKQPIKTDLSIEKLESYHKDKTNITFRLKLHPEYFVTGIIYAIKTEDELFEPNTVTNEDEEYYEPRNVPSHLITIQLNNKELAYFADYEIDFETIIPTSYNPIRYFTRGVITPELRDEVFKRDNYQCKNNLQGCTNKAECCDHIIPVIKGGLTIIDNLQASCNNCNLKKGSNMIL